MPPPRPPDVLRWVREGERLFGQLLESLQRHEEVERENRALQAEIQAVREELHQLREERAEVAETLTTFAEHVSRVATIAIQRLGKRLG